MGKNRGLIFERSQRDATSAGMATTPMADRCGHCTPEEMGVIVAHICQEAMFLGFYGRTFGQEKRKRLLRIHLKLAESRDLGGFLN